MNFDLIDLLNSYRTICFYGGGAKVTEHRGTIQYMSSALLFLALKVTHWHSPRFHGYFPTGNSFPAILGDILSDAIGCVGFSWVNTWLFKESNNLFTIVFTNKKHTIFPFFENPVSAESSWEKDSKIRLIGDLLVFDQRWRTLRLFGRWQQGCLTSIHPKPCCSTIFEELNRTTLGLRLDLFSDIRHRQLPSINFMFFLPMTAWRDEKFKTLILKRSHGASSKQLITVCR